MLAKDYTGIKEIHTDNRGKLALATPYRTYIFYCDSFSDQSEWMFYIKAIGGFYRTKNDHGYLLDLSRSKAVRGGGSTLGSVNTTARIFLKHIYAHTTIVLELCTTVCAQLRASKSPLGDKLAGDVSLCTVREVRAILDLSRQIYAKKNIQEVIGAVEGVREIMDAISKCQGQLNGKTDRDKLASGLKGLQSCISVVYEVPLPDVSRDISTMSKELVRSIIKLNKSPPAEWSKIYQEVQAACADMENIIISCIQAYETVPENKDLQESMQKISDCTKKLKTQIAMGKPLNELTAQLSPALKKLNDLAEEIYEPMSQISPPEHK